MASELDNLSSGTQRTRRNIMKIGAILVPASLAKIHSAAASEEVCVKLLGEEICVSLPILGGGSGNKGNCFLKATKIRTAEGERKIEDLAVGDLLPTMFGGLRPVQWIGRYRYKKSDPSKPWVKDALPVRIARSALAPDVPYADLYVTAHHSLLIDGVLAPAELLINGTTITRDELTGCDELEYFHIKLESHDVIYAEGAPAETLLNVEESAVNFAEYFRQYGTPATDENRCAPYVDILGGREELKSRFRSALSPWIDLRNQAEVIRDRLEEGGFISSWQSAPA
jgi:Hint domain